MSDELLTPTIHQFTAPARQPWDVASLLYPAVFGGALAATVLGLINGYRLGVGTARQALVATVGTAVLALHIVAVVAIADRGYELLPALTVAAGMLVWSATRATQLRAERAFLLRGGESAPLWRPGLAAAVGGGLIEGLLIMAAAYLVNR